MPEETQFFIVEYTTRSWKDIDYITGTASLWKDTVDTMDVSIKYSQPVPFHFLDVYHPDYDYTGDSLVWHFDHYEPPLKEDIRVKILNDWRDEGAAAIPKQAFEPRHVSDVTYKFDKQYVRFTPEVRDENPNNACGSLESPQYFADEIALIRNEIFARHGYVFATPKYRKHFSNMKWYRENPRYSDKQLNYIEKRNVSYLKCIEDAAKSMDAEFSKYFYIKGNTQGILYYCDSMDGEPDGHDPRDQTYYGYESSYLQEIKDCYMTNLP